MTSTDPIDATPVVSLVNRQGGSKFTNQRRTSLRKSNASREARQTVRLKFKNSAINKRLAQISSVKVSHSTTSLTSSI